MYFRKRLSLAMGIVASGFAVGQIVLAPLLDYLIDQYGWRGSMVITAGIMLHATACGALVRPVSARADKGTSQSQLGAETELGAEDITTIGGIYPEIVERNTAKEDQSRPTLGCAGTACAEMSNGDSNRECFDDRGTLRQKNDDDGVIQSTASVVSGMSCDRETDTATHDLYSPEDPRPTETTKTNNQVSTSSKTDSNLPPASRWRHP